MAATRIGLVLCLLMAMARKAVTMSNCETKSAICTFNDNLRGTILFQERHGFGCSTFGGTEGLHVQVNVQGFDPGDSVTAHTFRIKSYAGLRPNCSKMGPDYGQGVRSSDLGTFPEGAGGVVQVANVEVKNGPTLATAQSIIGRSVAVIKGKVSQNTFQPQPEITLGCCIIGVANFGGSDNNGNGVANSGFKAPNRASTFRNNNPFGSSPATTYNTPATNNNFINNRGFGGNPPPALPTYDSPIRRQSAATRPTPQSIANTFTSSTFRSPFALGDRFFFDLSGKESNVDKVLPDSIKKRFDPPAAPRFQDIYGLDSGDSPLGRSGNAVAPGKGNAFSKMFFKGNDIASTVNVGLSAEEMDIPRESGEEESSQTYHQDKNVNDDPGYKDALDGPRSSDENGPPPGSYDTPRPLGTNDVGKASFLDSKLKSLSNANQGDIEESERYHNGQTVDENSVPSSDTAADGTGSSQVSGQSDAAPVSAVPYATPSADAPPQASGVTLPVPGEKPVVAVAVSQGVASSASDESQAPNPQALPVSPASSA